MKHFYLIPTLFATLLFASTASAQITIDEVDTKKEDVRFKDQLKSTAVDVDYFSLARYKAERAEIRKQRNYLEFGGGIQGSLTSYSDSWIATSGGDNSIAVIASFNLRHLFTKGLFSIDTKFSARIGYNRIKVEMQRIGSDGQPMLDANGNKVMESQGIWFKNQDEFVFWTAPSFKMSEHWSYGSTISFRSQFVNGYRSRTEQKKEHLKSKFMTPAYLDVSLGVTYKSPKAKFPIILTLSPLSLSGTFVESDWIRRRQVKQSVDNEGKVTETEIKPAYNYGIEDPDKTSKYEGGSSLQIDFDRKFGKTGFLRYKTTIYSFFGWITDIGQRNKISNYTQYRHAYDKWATGDKNIKDKPRLPIHPTVRWENTLEIKATKYLSTTLNFQLYYNRAQNTEIMTQTLLSVGLSYTFKNKEKPHK